MRQKENSRNSGSEKFYSASSTLSADWQDSSVCSLLRHVSAQEVPAAEDLHSPESLQQHLNALCEPPYSVIVVGDIMLGGRAKSRLAEHGPDYPFAAVLPLLRRAPIVAGNLEGPFAKKARRQQRNFSYRVNPSLASALPRANINVLTLANNHLLDCGRSGVLETLDALGRAGLAPLGAGANEEQAHRPVVREAGRWRIGLLGYYWNRRTAATADQPGSAMDPAAALETDRKSTRLNSSHVSISYAVFCLKKKMVSRYHKLYPAIIPWTGAGQAHKVVFPSINVRRLARIPTTIL